MVLLLTHLTHILTLQEMSKHKKYIKLWVKWRPEYATTPQGTTTLKNAFKTQSEEKSAKDRLIKYVVKHYHKLWQARIYDATGKEIHVFRPENQNYEN